MTPGGRRDRVDREDCPLISEVLWWPWQEALQPLPCLHWTAHLADSQPLHGQGSCPVISFALVYFFTAF